MADLTTTSNNGSQAATQNPQGLVSSGTSTESSTKVQPGTANNLLNSGSGVALHPTQLSTVSLSTNTTGPAASSVALPVTAPAQHHHVNIGLFSISIVLLLVAIISVLLINRSTKNTTEYA